MTYSDIGQLLLFWYAYEHLWNVACCSTTPKFH